MAPVGKIKKNVNCHNFGCIQDSVMVWEGNNVQNSAGFRTTLDFDGKYLQNG